jgi:hypothetical protein
MDLLKITVLLQTGLAQNGIAHKEFTQNYFVHKQDFVHKKGLAQNGLVQNFFA